MLELLLTVLSGRMRIPYDIIKLIKIFSNFPLLWNTYLLSLHQQKLFDIESESKGEYQPILNQIQFGFDIPFIITPNCLFSQCDLPNYVQEELKFCQIEFPKSQKWSLLFQFGRYKHTKNIVTPDAYRVAEQNVTEYTSNSTCYLTAMHCDGINHINNTINMHQFKLPLIEEYEYNTDFFPSCGIYSNHNQSFYVTTECGERLFQLDLKKPPTRCHWKNLSNKLLYKREGTAMCMVDNDRFISIIGGGSDENQPKSKHVELFALNCNVSIKLSDTNEAHGAAASSLYHKKYHKIILCGSENMELYDINKDKWVNLKALSKRAGCLMTISTENPNIIYSECFDPISGSLVLYQDDLRNDLPSQLVYKCQEAFQGYRVLRF